MSTVETNNARCGGLRRDVSHCPCESPPALCTFLDCERSALGFEAELSKCRRWSFSVGDGRLSFFTMRRSVAAHPSHVLFALLAISCAGEDPEAEMNGLGSMPSSTTPVTSMPPPTPVTPTPQGMPTSSATVAEPVVPTMMASPTMTAGPTMTVPASTDTTTPTVTTPAMTDPLPIPEPTGMPGMPVEMGPAEPDVMTFYELDYLLGLTCATPSCHTPIYFEPDLTNAYGDLYDILTTYTVEQCNDNPLVIPGDAENSAMMMLIYGECSEFAMPLECMDPPCLFQEDVDKYAAWINAGAPAD